MMCEVLVIQNFKYVQHQYDSINKLLIKMKDCNRTNFLCSWCMSCWFTVSLKKVKHEKWTISQVINYYQTLRLTYPLYWWCVKYRWFTISGICNMNKILLGSCGLRTILKQNLQSVLMMCELLMVYEKWRISKLVNLDLTLKLPYLLC